MISSQFLKQAQLFPSLEAFLRLLYHSEMLLLLVNFPDPSKIRLSSIFSNRYLFLFLIPTNIIFYHRNPQGYYSYLLQHHLPTMQQLYTLRVLDLNSTSIAFCSVSNCFIINSQSVARKIGPVSMKLKIWVETLDSFFQRNMVCTHRFLKAEDGSAKRILERLCQCTDQTFPVTGVKKYPSLCKLVRDGFSLTATKSILVNVLSITVCSLS